MAAEGGSNVRHRRGASYLFSKVVAMPPHGALDFPTHDLCPGLQYLEFLPVEGPYVTAESSEVAFLTIVLMRYYCINGCIFLMCLL